MPYDADLADRVRLYLAEVPRIKVTEKTMFRGLAFLVNGKMCINVSRENLMCRLDPERYEEVSKRKGFMPMIMRGKKLNGYCYVNGEGFRSDKDFDFWMRLCLEFNPSARSSKKRDASKGVVLVEKLSQRSTAKRSTDKGRTAKRSTSRRSTSKRSTSRRSLSNSSSSKRSSVKNTTSKSSSSKSGSAKNTTSKHSPSKHSSPRIL